MRQRVGSLDAQARTLTQPTPDWEIAARIVVINPPVGVMFGLQRGRADIVSPVVADGSELSFNLTLRVRADNNGQPRFLGPFAQGPPAARFVYVNSGTYAGQKDTVWGRRAKIHLQGVTWALVEKLSASRTAVLQARIAGTGRDGGPACGPCPCWTAGGPCTPISNALRERLAALAPAELDGPPAVPFPAAGQTMLSALTLVEHDSYHIGQLALLRKHAGLPAMRYT